MKHVIPLAGLGVCLTIGAAIGGVAIANSSDSPDIVKSPEAAVALLRGPAASTSENLFASKLGQAFARQGGYAIDPSTARAVEVDGVTVWVAPNDKKETCSATEVERVVTLNCAASTVVASEGLFSTRVAAPGADQTAIVVGVVPDGVSQVWFNGSSTPSQAVDNVVVRRFEKAPSGATLVSNDGATAITFGGHDAQ